MNHITHTRSQFDYNRKQVLWLTGMTEEQLYAFQFDTGMDWLEQYTGDDRQLLFNLMKQPLIWKWWVLQWNRRDDEMILEALYKYPADERAFQYRAHHQLIFIKQALPYCLLEDSYARVIGEVNDHFTQSHKA